VSRSGSPVEGGDGAGLEALEVGGAAVDGIALRRGYVGAGEHCEIIGVGPVDVDWVTSLLPEAMPATSNKTTATTTPTAGPAPPTT